MHSRRFGVISRIMTALAALAADCSSTLAGGIWENPLFAVPAGDSSCPPSTCYSAESFLPEALQDLKKAFPDRIEKIIDAWYRGKKCDFNQAGALGDDLCTHFIPGATVGRICDISAATPELQTNQLGQSCGGTCRALMSCSNTYTSPDASESLTFTINDNPKLGCQLCQLSVTAPNKKTWDGYKLPGFKGDGGALLAAGIGSSSGTSCGCCTIRVDYASCEKQQSYVRGAMVQATRVHMNRMLAELSTGTPRITIRSPACADILQKLHTLNSDLHAKKNEKSLSCRGEDSSYTNLERILRRPGLMQGACLREGVKSFIDYSAAFLAACSVLESAEEVYVTLQPAIRNVIRSLDCSSETSVAGCVNRLDRDLMRAIKDATSP